MWVRGKRRKRLYYLSTETLQLIKVFSDNQIPKSIQQSAVTQKGGVGRNSITQQAEVSWVGGKRQGQPLHYIRGFLLTPIASNLLNTGALFVFPALWKIIDNVIKWQWARVRGGLWGM